MQSFNDRLAQLEGRLGPQAITPRTPPEAGHSDGPLREQAPSEQMTHDSFGEISPPIAMDATAEQSGFSRSTRLLSQPRTQTTHNPDYHHNDEGFMHPDDDSFIDAMGVAHLTPEETKAASGEFYGKSSAASFLSHIQGRLHSESDNRTRAKNSSDTSFGPAGLSGPLHSRMSQTDDYHLPPRHMADHLLDLYYTRVQCLYPYLHWPTLMDAYRLLWMSESELKAAPPLKGVGIGGPQCSQPMFYCALNVIFALGAQFSSGSAQERKSRAKPYARRARHLLRLDYLDHGDIALVQALLIMAHYLQSTNMPTRCWSVAGVAYRMAQGLGLHLEIGENVGSTLYREMRRRVWYSCVCLDV